tara:strand:- start:95 stop:319 length:225 start_codon:yes stop_codon:yes gene_type:complete
MKKKNKKSNICLSCGHDFNEEYYHLHPPMNKDDKEDVLLAKEYCSEQSLRYNHTNCKPLWCDDCQLLTGYLVDY